MSINNLLYSFSRVFKKTIQQTLVLDISLIKLLPDSKKAFSIDHQILLTKMNYLGFSKKRITWFKSYLCQRKLRISINTSYSSPSNLLYGVPQGSILGTSVLLLCINDFTQAVVCDSLLYADDTCIVFQHKSEIEIEKQLTRDFSSLCDCGLLTTG